MQAEAEGGKRSCPGTVLPAVVPAINNRRRMMMEPNGSFEAVSKL